MEHAVRDRTSQNVTVALPQATVQAAKHLAVDQGLSLSEFVKQLIEARVRRESHYNQVMAESLQLMDESTFRLAPAGITWTRSELHER
ncbi:MAG: hypothetical protein ACRDHX_09240 [Chloroflexota bacterium]